MVGRCSRRVEDTTVGRQGTLASSTRGRPAVSVTRGEPSGVASPYPDQAGCCKVPWHSSSRAAGPATGRPPPTAEEVVGFGGCGCQCLKPQAGLLRVLQTDRGSHPLRAHERRRATGFRYPEWTERPKGQRLAAPWTSRMLPGLPHAFAPRGSYSELDRSRGDDSSLDSVIAEIRKSFAACHFQILAWVLLRTD